MGKIEKFRRRVARLESMLGSAQRRLEGARKDAGLYTRVFDELVGGHPNVCFVGHVLYFNGFATYPQRVEMGCDWDTRGGSISSIRTETTWTYPDYPEAGMVVQDSRNAPYRRIK